MRIIDIRHKLPKHKYKRYKRRKLKDIRRLAIHHSLTTTGDPYAFANYHINKHNWPGIGYAYVIQRDGTIYWCSDLEEITYHVGNSNRHALGICLVGDFRKQTPTPEQYNALAFLCNNLLKQLQITLNDIWGHNQFPGYSWKQCPGQNFDMKKLKAGVNKMKVLNENVLEIIRSCGVIISRLVKGEDITLQIKYTKKLFDDYERRM